MSAALRNDPLSVALAAVRRLSDEGLRAVIAGAQAEAERRHLADMRAGLARGDLLVWERGKRHVARTAEGLRSDLGSDIGWAEAATARCGRLLLRTHAGLRGKRPPPVAGGEWSVKTLDADCAACLSARRS